MTRTELLEKVRTEREYAAKCMDHAKWLDDRGYFGYAAGERRLASEAIARALECEAKASLIAEVAS